MRHRPFSNLQLSDRFRTKKCPCQRSEFFVKEFCELPQWYIYNMLVMVTVVARWGIVRSFLSLVDVSAARLVVHLTGFMACWGVMDCLAALHVTVKRQRRRLRTYNVYIVLSEA